MARAIRIHAFGGPEAMRWEEVAVGDPGPGEVRLRQTAVGLNFIDTYDRNGSFPIPPLPAVIGHEAAGRVEAVGPGVDGVAVGDRVAYVAPPVGAYAEARLMPADRLVPVPDGVSDEQAAAVLLKGMSAEYLLHRAHAVQPGDTILVHAAAGGVGMLICQWARHIGATVIGTVGTRAKADLAAAHGCHHPIVHGEADFVAAARDLTGGAGVDAVYDSVGRDTFVRSLDCVRRRGILISFGTASGPVPPIDLDLIARKGSLYVTRTMLMSYTGTRPELTASAAAVFDALARGAIRVMINRTYPLRDAARAHADLEGRRTTGSTVLLP